jgi:hypothetical protein
MHDWHFLFFREKALAVLSKQFILSAVKVIAITIIELKKKKVPYDELSKLLKEGQKLNIKKNS